MLKSTVWTILLKLVQTIFIAVGATALDILAVSNLNEWKLDIRSDLVMSSIVVWIAMRGVQSSAPIRHRRRSPWRHDLFNFLFVFYAAHAHIIRLFSSKVPSIGQLELTVGHAIAFSCL